MKTHVNIANTIGFVTIISEADFGEAKKKGDIYVGRINKKRTKII